MCNEKLKFGTLISRAQQLGAEFIATGHFARVEKKADGGRMLLKRGRDAPEGPELFSVLPAAGAVGADQVSLGELTKSDTRCVAREND